MGFFSSLTKTVLDVAVLPIEIVKDVATLGGVCTDQHEPYSMQRLKQANYDLNQAIDSLDK
jgi:hypothetical protein